MVSSHRSRKGIRKGIPRHRPASFRPLLELLENRTLLTTCTVTENLDDVPALDDSLRDCMEQEPDEIVFDFESLPVEIELVEALPDITYDLEIVGVENPEDITVLGGGESNPFSVIRIVREGLPPPPTVKFSGFTISGGFAPDGGGIYNKGQLTIDNCVITGNVAAPVDDEIELLGGGIHSTGNLHVVGSSITLNSVFGNGAWLYGGGGVYSSGDALIEYSDVSFNTVCPDGEPCDGELNSQPDVKFHGAGFHNNNGHLEIHFSTIDSNVVNAIDPGIAMAFRGTGSGIQSDCGNDPNCLVVTYSTISNNRVELTGAVSTTGGDRTAVHGGAISVAGVGTRPNEPEVVLLNATLANNSITSDVTLAGGCPSNCRAAGGALWFKAIYVDIKWSTIAGNEVESSIRNEDGGGIFVSDDPNDDGRLVMRSTIVATNMAGDEEHSVGADDFDIESDGYNLFNDEPLGSDGTGDLINKDVCFWALDDYGGETLTMRPNFCSGVIWPKDNGGPRDSSVLEDQRGFDRPATDTDIGAVECQPENDCDFEGFGPPPIPPPPGGPGSDGVGGFGEFEFSSASASDASNANQLSARATTLEDQELPAETPAFFVDRARRIATDVDHLETMFVELALEV